MALFRLTYYDELYRDKREVYAESETISTVIDLWTRGYGDTDTKSLCEIKSVSYCKVLNESDG